MNGWGLVCDICIDFSTCATRVGSLFFSCICLSLSGLQVRGLHNEVVWIRQWCWSGFSYFVLLVVLVSIEYFHWIGIRMVGILTFFCTTLNQLCHRFPSSQYHQSAPSLIQSDLNIAGRLPAQRIHLNLLQYSTCDVIPYGGLYTDL